jgi:hypothetical protein
LNLIRKKMIDVRNHLITGSMDHILAEQLMVTGFKADYLIVGKASLTSSGPQR